MPSADIPTDEILRVPWRLDSAPPPPPVLHLVVAWFLDEPERVGECAPLDCARWLGRRTPRDVDGSHLILRQSRPSELLPGTPIENSAISHRQLYFEPREHSSVHVRCEGLRALFHNGVPVTECVARAGDTLMLEDAAVFILEERPVPFPPLRHYRAPAFPFGAPDPDGMVGESVAAWALRDELAAFVGGDDHLLLTGDSGTGKELAARFVHRLAAGAGKPFVSRNAAVLPPGLIDAELFGTARNYPNPGTPERAGLVGAADGGTLFLDEIGQLPPEHQAHLLRVVDSHGEYQRLGESQLRQSRFRLVAATNRHPSTLKHDFLARFAGRIRVPGFGQRLSDVPLLARELLRQMAVTVPDVARFLEGGIPRFAPVLVDLLLRHPYTHHARELRRLLRVAVNTSPGDHLVATPRLHEALLENDASADAPPDERRSITAALAGAGGNVSRAADELGLSRHALHRLIKKHGLEGVK